MKQRKHITERRETGEDAAVKRREVNGMQKTAKRQSNTASSIVFFLLLAVYLATMVALPRVSRAEGELLMFGISIPISACTGVISSLANICVIFLAVFFRKRGFFAALVLLLIQYPILIFSLLVAKNLASLPGAFGNLLTIVAIILIYRRNKRIEEYQAAEVGHLQEQQKFSTRLFEQTATALVSAIDESDNYSHGHSLRVAEYSEKIAKRMGKDEDECRKVYYAALLHDVGKIGIPESILNKNGKLTPAEYEVIKQHPAKGNRILSGISAYPYLSIAAHHHHERYDGKGYPDKLKGEDIPEIARIISVADAYDAMSSRRAYRNAIPQQLIREEFVKCSGTQFDPEITKIMQNLIDSDVEYRMKEQETASDITAEKELECKEYRSEVSDGIVLNDSLTKIRLQVTPKIGADIENKTALVLFDSLDGRVHDDEKMKQDLCYYEYAEIFLDGEAVNKGVRKIETKTADSEAPTSGAHDFGSTIYDVEAVKCRDHVLITIDDGKQKREITIALPDSSRYAFLAMTGAFCRISNVSVEKEETPVPDGYITRIAEEVSYITRPDGDVPNIQVDGYRSATTKGIPLKNKLSVRFHTLSLPTARLVWHCPFWVIYSSDDGTVGGGHYREFALIRLDGEYWESEGVASNRLLVNKLAGFEGWDGWKTRNKQGFESSAVFERKDNTIVMNTVNLGISINNTTTILDGTKDVYVALTGDQCALTSIRIENN